MGMLSIIKQSNIYIYLIRLHLYLYKAVTILTLLNNDMIEFGCAPAASSWRRRLMPYVVTKSSAPPTNFYPATDAHLLPALFIFPETCSKEKFR